MNPIIEKALKNGNILLEPEAMRLFAEYGIPTPEFSLVNSVGEAAAFADSIGYPVVLKISSRDIIHKSDVGGVKAGIKNRDELMKAYSEIMDSVAKACPDARIEGINVMKHAEPGLECIVGMTKDPQFGSVIMFGLGGIFVEVLKDVSLQLTPISSAEAYDMIAGIKGVKLLTGYRGQPPKDIDAVADLIVKVAKLVEDNPEIKELDMNPVFVYESGVLAVDARIIC